jgi:predicted RNA binding protein YcfA (HicA-like mRNA interferase family)
VRLPRDLSGADLIRGLERVGYRVTRQTGSHVRLTLSGEQEHHVTVPIHDPLRVGTLAAILAEVAAFLGIDRDELLGRLDRR